jgi:tRNA-specific 2-thiouridylase
MVCNREIRWGFLLKHALHLGAQKLATGHYAQLTKGPDQRISLRRAVDRKKDQSYILSILSQEQLQHASFPIGGLTKPQVRKLAAEFNLPVAARPDSQDLCFITSGNYRAFLATHAPGVLSPGPIINRTGTILGEHPGLAGYTIGQRKGLGVSAQEPLYVLEKDVAQNTLIVGTKAELGERELTAKEMNWVAGYPPEESFEATIQIRYQATEVHGRVTPLENHRINVVFNSSIRGITPGQIAAVYRDDLCLGSGIIEAG